MRRQSLAWEWSHGRTHGNSHDERDGTGGAQCQTSRRGDRHPHAADPDADGGQDSGDAQPQIAECPVPMPQVMIPESARGD